MSDYKKEAKTASAAKMQRMGLNLKDGSKSFTDERGGSPFEGLNSGNAGKKPITPSRFKRGGKVAHMLGEKAHKNLGKSTRRKRDEGGGIETTDAPNPAPMPPRKGDKKYNPFPYLQTKKQIGDQFAKEHPDEPTDLGSKGSGYARGGKTSRHPDEAEDRKLIRKEVKPSALKHRAHKMKGGTISDYMDSARENLSANRKFKDKQRLGNLMSQMEDSPTRPYSPRDIMDTEKTIGKRERGIRMAADKLSGRAKILPSDEEPMKKGGRAEKCWGGEAKRSKKFYGGPITSQNPMLGIPNNMPMPGMNGGMGGGYHGVDSGFINHPHRDHMPMPGGFRPGGSLGFETGMPNLTMPQQGGYNPGYMNAGGRIQRDVGGATNVNPMQFQGSNIPQENAGRMQHFNEVRAQDMENLQSNLARQNAHPYVGQAPRLNKLNSLQNYMTQNPMASFTDAMKYYHNQMNPRGPGGDGMNPHGPGWVGMNPRGPGGDEMDRHRGMQRNTGGRVQRATGGAAKGKTNVNIIISPQGGGQGQDPMGAGVGMGQPPTPPMMPPMPQGGMPQGGMPQGGMPPMGGMPSMGGMPPMGGGMPPMGGGMPPMGGMPSMPYKTGGRVGNKMPKYQEKDYGSGSGLGRLVKRKWPTANGTE